MEAPENSPQHHPERQRYVAVRGARETALARQEHPNARLTTLELDEYVPLDAPMRGLLVQAAERHNLSARALQSLRRVARTLADLDEADNVNRNHLGEALTLRLEL